MCVSIKDLNPNLPFSIRGYKVHRNDRVSRSKEGVVTVMKNSLPCKEVPSQELPLNLKSLVMLCKYGTDNYYCPNYKALSLNAMPVTEEDCLVVRYFLPGGTISWIKEEKNSRHKIATARSTYLTSRTTNPLSTPVLANLPDLTFVTTDLRRATARKVLEQLDGSDHRPIRI